MTQYTVWDPHNYPEDEGDEAPATLDFHVPGDPKPEKKRQRVFKRKGGQPVMGSRTDEPEQVDFKARVAWFAKQACPAPLDGPLRVTIIVWRSRPPSYPKKPTKAKPWPWAWTSRPDRTNYEKIIEDALNGIAWLDDAQIVDGITLKRWGVPGVRVIVERLETEGDLYRVPAARERGVA